MPARMAVASSAAEPSLVYGVEVARFLGQVGHADQQLGAVDVAVGDERRPGRALGHHSLPRPAARVGVTEEGPEDCWGGVAVC